MEKVVWLLWGPAGEPVDVVDRFRPLAADPSVLALTVLQHDEAAAGAPSPVPIPDGERTHVAQVSAFLDCYERRDAVESLVAATGHEASAYLVSESLYDDYGSTRHAGPRDWPDGERSPGVLTVALIHRPTGLDRDEWIRRWHGTQSPVSAELQPRTRYVRNEVVRSLDADAFEVDGIVEEAWPSARHVADPDLFFNGGGDPARVQANLEKMMESVTACLDLGRLRNTTMSEYLLRSSGSFR